MTPCTAAHQSSPSVTVSRSFLKLMPIESVMPSSHLILGLPLLLLPSTFLSIRVFSNESTLHIRWPKYQSFSISRSNEYSGLISFKLMLCSLCSPRASQESSRVLEFESINLSVLSLLSGPTLTSIHYYWKNHQFGSVAQSGPMLCDPTDCTTTGFPVLHQLLDLAQTHVYPVGNAIQLSHPLLSPFPSAFNLSRIRSFPRGQFFPLDGQSIGASASASVLPMNIQE